MLLLSLISFVAALVVPLLLTLLVFRREKPESFA
jgi:hypothetical protein